MCTPAFLNDFCLKIRIVLVKSKLNKDEKKGVTPLCPIWNRKNHEKHHVFIDLLSFEVSFTLIGVLFYFLSFPQLSSSLQTNIARRTNNLSLAEMSFSLLRPIMFFGIWNNAARARALTSLLLPPLYTNVNWVGEFPTNGCKIKLFSNKHSVE